jgi:hypothetical protein
MSKAHFEEIKTVYRSIQWIRIKLASLVDDLCEDSFYYDSFLFYEYPETRISMVYGMILPNIWDTISLDTPRG